MSTFEDILTEDSALNALAWKITRIASLLPEKSATGVLRDEKARAKLALMLFIESRKLLTDMAETDVCD